MSIYRKKDVSRYEMLNSIRTLCEEAMKTCDLDAETTLTKIIQFAEEIKVENHNNNQAKQTMNKLCNELSANKSLSSKTREEIKIYLENYLSKTHYSDYDKKQDEQEDYFKMISMDGGPGEGYPTDRIR